jgi:hypothetical protein
MVMFQNSIFLYLKKSFYPIFDSDFDPDPGGAQMFAKNPPGEWGSRLF